MFTIHVANKGNGEVLKPGKVKEACTSGSSAGIEVQDYNTFDYEVRLGGENGEPLQCSPERFRLKSDADFIRCSLPVGKQIPIDQYSYTTPLYIKLDYGYVFSISKSVDIKRLTSVP